MICPRCKKQHDGKYKQCENCRKYTREKEREYKNKRGLIKIKGEPTNFLTCGKKHHGQYLHCEDCFNELLEIIKMKKLCLNRYIEKLKDKYEKRNIEEKNKEISRLIREIERPNKEVVKPNACIVCGQEIEQSRMGRPKIYCNACAYQKILKRHEARRQHGKNN